MKRLAVITTHPIQYYAPVFKMLNERKKITLKVFYTLGENAVGSYDPGFKKKITWDIPLLDGYNYEWVVNTSPTPGSYHFRGIINPQLNNLIIDFHPDAILLIGWAYDSHLKALNYFYGKVPVYFRGDSNLLDPTNWFKEILRTIHLKRVYSKVAHAFYVGTANKAYYKKYGLKESQLSFAPHAVDNERFAEERKHEVLLLKRDLKIDEDALLILFVGKFEEKKDPMLLLDAFITLANSNLNLIFTGNGILEKQLKAKAAPYVNIHFLPFQNQSYMPVVYQACDLFCLPSKGPGETWGLAVNEAMACGKAILVADKCGCAENLVIKGENGSIFKSGDVNELALQLKQLTQGKALLKNYGVTSAAMIKSWSFQHIAIAIEHKLINETE